MGYDVNFTSCFRVISLGKHLVWTHLLKQLAQLERDFPRRLLTGTITTDCLSRQNSLKSEKDASEMILKQANC